MKKIVSIITLTLLAIGSTGLAMQDSNELTEKEKTAIALICMNGNVIHTTQDFTFPIITVPENETRPLAKEVHTGHFNSVKNQLLLSCHLRTGDVNSPTYDAYETPGGCVIDCKTTNIGDAIILKKLFESNTGWEYNAYYYNNQIFMYACCIGIGEQLQKSSKFHVDTFNKQKIYFNFWKVSGHSHGLFLAVAQKKGDDKRLYVYLYGDKPYTFFREIAVLDEDDFPMIPENFVGTMGIVISPKHGKIHFFQFDVLPKFNLNNFQDVTFNYGS